MKRILLAAVVSLSVSAVSFAQTSPAPDFRTFELTAVAPPTPALKYQLLFDDLGERRPGNAAILYLDSILLLPQDTQDQAKKALDAYSSGDLKTFDTLADSFADHSVFEE